MAAQQNAAVEHTPAVKAEAELESLKRFRQKLQIKQDQAKGRKRKARSQKPTMRTHRLTTKVVVRFKAEPLFGSTRLSADKHG
jgi:hypothetical protein